MTLPGLSSNSLMQQPTVGPRGDKSVEPLIFEKHVADICAVDFPPLDVPESALNSELLGADINLPSFGQHDVMAHYTHLSDRNFSVDGNFYPLGSCTMKHNPRINEWAASRPGFASLHPLQDDDTIQGALRLLYETRVMLEEISGLHEVSLQPAAGAHGEFTALKVIRAYYVDHGQPGRTVVLAADTAHGTNPASCTMCGASVETVRTVDGQTDLNHLKEVISSIGSDKIACFMITNPSTAGLFDSNIKEISKIIHDAGAMLYLDGANMNAIVGKVKPGEFGADAMHYNTHKTFSTPHGGGGPGSGPIAVTEALAPYLPVPQVMIANDGSFYLDRDRPKTIGKVRSFIGQFGVLVRCWTYISACGPEGLVNIAETAVLNANYIATCLNDLYSMPYFDSKQKKFCAHEFVTVPQNLLDKGVTLNDIAKRMIDYNIHPPTMHWPVHDCLMVEPTETESKASLDNFIGVMRKIAAEIEEDIKKVQLAPLESDISRADEVSAARNPVVVFTE